jgi:putative transposase
MKSRIPAMVTTPRNPLYSGQFANSPWTGLTSSASFRRLAFLRAPRPFLPCFLDDPVSGHYGVVQQLREAFPDAVAHRYAILDHDSKFDADVIAFLKATGPTPKRTSVQAPWQNGVAERWVGSCRREILDHVITLNERHLRRLVREYVSYYHDDPSHDALDKDTPDRRPVESKPSPSATVISSARLGGLHHRYSWCEAA